MRLKKQQQLQEEIRQMELAIAEQRIRKEQQRRIQQDAHRQQQEERRRQRQQQQWRQQQQRQQQAPQWPQQQVPQSQPQQSHVPFTDPGRQQLHQQQQQHPPPPVRRSQPDQSQQERQQEAAADRRRQLLEAEIAAMEAAIHAQKEKARPAITQKKLVRKTRKVPRSQKNGSAGPSSSGASSSPPPPMTTTGMSSSPPPLSPDQEATAAVYQKMLKLGLPEGAVMHKMAQDGGIDENVFRAVLGVAAPPPGGTKGRTSVVARPPVLRQQQQQQSQHPQQASVVLSSAEQATANRFRKMLKMKIPEGAVRHKMLQEGVDANVVNAVLGVSSIGCGAVVDGKFVRAPPPNPPPSLPLLPSATARHANLMSSISQAASSRDARVASSGGITEPPPKPASAGSRVPPFLAGIAQAAADRDKRVRDGDTFMREFEPEIAERRAVTPQLSFDLAEMVSKRARERDARLDAGGEKKMTVIKEKEEYKEDFKTICREAAELGRLTALPERCVESVAKEKTPEQEWRSSGLLSIQWRSSHMSVIHQAASLGAELKLPEKIVTNGEVETVDYDFDDVDTPVLERIARLNDLKKDIGAGQQKVDHIIMGRKLQAREGMTMADSMLVKPMTFYSNVEEVQLPRKYLPKFDAGSARKRIANAKREATASPLPMLDIGNEVAARAWERRARLDRPNVLPKIKEVCHCPYCVTASPFQTFAYKIKEQRRKELGYESPEEEEEPKYGLKHREQERTRADHLRRQQKHTEVEEKTVGMNAARRMFGMTKAEIKQQEEDKRLQAEREKRRIHEEQERKRLEAEQEKLRIQQEQERKRLEAEQEKLRIQQEMEQRRVQEEQELKRIKEEQEQKRMQQALEQKRLQQEQEQRQLDELRQNHVRCSSAHRVPLDNGTPAGNEYSASSSVASENPDIYPGGTVGGTVSERNASCDVPPKQKRLVHKTRRNTRSAGATTSSSGSSTASAPKQKRRPPGAGSTKNTSPPVQQRGAAMSARNPEQAPNPVQPKRKSAGPPRSSSKSRKGNSSGNSTSPRTVPEGGRQQQQQGRRGLRPTAPAGTRQQQQLQQGRTEPPLHDDAASMAMAAATGTKKTFLGRLRKKN